jgi:translation elongation factor EF-Tu-like GTPase
MATRLHGIRDDFEANIRILKPEEGGRATPAFNGIRWDFQYIEDAVDQLWMIHPDFVDIDQNSLPTDKVLSVGVELRARTVILNTEMRAKVHRERIRVGTNFFCKEGTKTVAVGEVTRITGLFDDRTQ